MGRRVQFQPLNNMEPEPATVTGVGEVTVYELTTEDGKVHRVYAEQDYYHLKTMTLDANISVLDD